MNERFIPQLFDALPVGVFQVNLKRECIYANSLCRKFWKYGDDDIGRDWEQLFLPEDLNELFVIWESLSPKQNFKKFRCSLYREEDIFECYMRCLAEFNEWGNPISYYAIIENVERYQIKLEKDELEKQLDINESRLRGIIKAIPDMILIIDQFDCFCEAHISNKDMLVQSEENFIGKKYYDCLPRSLMSQMKEKIELVRRTEEVQAIEYKLNVRGEERIFEARFVKCEELNVLMIIRDVTKEAQLSSYLIDARNNAEAIAEMKSQFLSNMSHEIRTPLNAIIGFLDLTLMSDLNEQQRQSLNIVKSRSQDLLAIINDVLELSRVEAGRASIDLSEVHLDKIINEIVLTFKPQWAPKGLTVEWSISPNIPDVILCDSIKLKQILNNLLNNAIKFSNSGTINITVSDTLPKEVAETSEKDKYYFSISDMGIGISQDKMDSIFDPFVQADCSTERLYGGTGLGLTICKRLIKLLGGKIWVRSTEGKGTTFYFSISSNLIDSI